MVIETLIPGKVGHSPGWRRDTETWEAGALVHRMCNDLWKRGQRGMDGSGLDTWTARPLMFRQQGPCNTGKKRHLYILNAEPRYMVR